jgi:hypothetical protein
MTQLTFVRVPGDQDSDPTFEMRAPDGRWTGISIQDSTAYGGGYTVNRYGSECPQSPLAGDYFLEDCGTFDTLTVAKACAAGLYTPFSSVH